MKKVLHLLLILIMSMIVFTACIIQPKSGSTSPKYDVTTGKWELVSADYSPVSYDICSAIYFPSFEGKSREEWEDYSISIGKIDNEFITWAVGGMLSPDGRSLGYISNKDCLEVNGTMSVFLLDMDSGKERVLLSGTDGHYYRIISWLDDQTLFCAQDNEALVCNLAGDVIPLKLDETAGATGATFPFAMQRRMLAYLTGSEEKTITLIRIEEDGSITELARKEYDGYPINFAGISPDGRWMAFPLRTNLGDDPSRTICLWNTADGTVSKLDNPIPTDGDNPAAISVQWKGDYPEVNFNISNAPDSNGHNELWRYIF